MSITPKVHAIEDHLVDQIRRLKGIGDLGEDFVERSHQDGIRQHSRSKNAKERADEAIQHCRWEHKRTHPAVLDKVAAMEAKSIRRENKWMKLDRSHGRGSAKWRKNHKLMLTTKNI